MSRFVGVTSLALQRLLRTLPAVTFGGAATFLTSVSTPILYNAAAGGVLFGAQSTTNFFGLNNWAANGTFQGRAGSVIGWGASTTNPDAAAPDTALSRISAGIIGVGTGAQGSIAGGLQMATLALGGASTIAYGGTNGTFVFRNSGNTAGGVLDVATNGTWKFFTSNGSTPAIITGVLQTSANYAAGVTVPTGSLEFRDGAGNTYLVSAVLKP